MDCPEASGHPRDAVAAAGVVAVFPDGDERCAAATLMMAMIPIRVPRPMSALRALRFPGRRDARCPRGCGPGAQGCCCGHPWGWYGSGCCGWPGGNEAGDGPQDARSGVCAISSCGPPCCQCPRRALAGLCHIRWRRTRLHRDREAGVPARRRIAVAHTGSIARRPTSAVPAALPDRDTSPEAPRQAHWRCVLAVAGSSRLPPPARHRQPATLPLQECARSVPQVHERYEPDAGS